VKLLLKTCVCDLYYLLFFLFTSPAWIAMMLARRSWRSGFLQRLGFIRLPPADRPRLWIHGVSVGEVLAARSLIRALFEDPRFEIVLSTTTRTGFAVARKTFPDVPVFHFPLDLSFCVRRTFRRVRPALVILVELEIWPNLLLHARRRGLPLTFVNGRITKRSAESYAVLSWILAPLLGATELFCVQNDVYASRLVHLGARGESVRITGNLKIDNLPADPDPARAASLRETLGIRRDETALVGGSIHPGEDEILVKAFLALSARFERLRLVLAPRHPEKFDRAREVARKHGLACRRRTEGPAPAGESPVLLLDTMGELQDVYAAGDLIFVGGSLIPHGGQNMMEPAALGKPVLFGPHIHNFREDAAFLIEKGGALKVEGPEALEAALSDLLSDPEKGAAMGRAGARAVGEKRGATDRTLDALETVYLDNL